MLVHVYALPIPVQESLQLAPSSTSSPLPYLHVHRQHVSHLRNTPPAKFHVPLLQIPGTPPALVAVSGAVHRFLLRAAKRARSRAAEVHAGHILQTEESPLSECRSIVSDCNVEDGSDEPPDSGGQLRLRALFPCPGAHS